MADAIHQLSELFKQIVAAGKERDPNRSYEMVLVASAKTAIERSFPAKHAYRLEVERLFKVCQQAMRAQTAKGYDHDATLRFGRGFAGIHSLVWAALNHHQQGYSQELMRAVELKTIGDVLLQAETLLAEGFVAAAAVLAGGALETHLKALVDNAKLVVKGAGSIAKYDQAIREQEKNGKSALYDKQASKEVIALGDVRNEAAHDPAHFEKSRHQQVALMIQRVRLFVREHP